MQLVWYKGKFWYCDYYNTKDNDLLELIDMKNHNDGINVYGDSKLFAHLCTDPKQYEAVKYWQEKNVAWKCILTLKMEKDVVF